MNVFKPTLSIFPFLLLILPACHEAEPPRDHLKTADTLMPNSSPAKDNDYTTAVIRDSAAAPDAAHTVVPGTRMATIALGIEAGGAIKFLGKPDRSDAAMGKAWMTWLGKGDQFNGSHWDIYTAYRDTSMQTKTIQLIRTTEPSLATPNGIKSGSPLDAIKKAFPELKHRGDYKQDNAGVISLYDVPDQGIAFELNTNHAGKPCTALIIYPKEKGLMTAYQTFLNINNWKAL